MRPTKFKIESLGCEVFDGFTKGEEWNGWDCPYFTFNQAQKFQMFITDQGKLSGKTISPFIIRQGTFHWIWEQLEE